MLVAGQGRKYPALRLISELYAWMKVPPWSRTNFHNFEQTPNVFVGFVIIV